MSRFLLSIVGPLIILGAFLLAAWWYFRPPTAPRQWLFPVGLLLVGEVMTVLRSGWRWLLGSTVASGLLVTLLVLSIWPSSAPTEDLQAAAEGRGGLVSVTLQVPGHWAAETPSGIDELQTVSGANVSVFAAGLGAPRMLAFSPAGDLYVSLPHAGKVVILPDRNHDGVAEEMTTFVENLDRPHGLAFVGSDLIVADNSRLVRLPDQDGNLVADRVEVISTDIPDGGGHWTRSVAIDPKGNFFVSAGSSCNVCIEKDPRRAAILRIGPTGGAAEIYAHGLRNSVGLAFHPETSELWASNNGRDMLGDDLPPEEINRIVEGGDYGWPFCYGDRIPGPDFGSEARCRDTLPPAVEMQAHSAPLGIAFGYGVAFPVHYRDMLYVAFNGSWNRSVPTGYKLIGIPFRNGRPSGPPEDIVSGWLQGRSAWGRPVAPAVGPDGALYLSDDRAGLIYRITMNTPSKGD